MVSFLSTLSNYLHGMATINDQETFHKRMNMRQKKQEPVLLVVFKVVVFSPPPTISS